MLKRLPRKLKKKLKKQGLNPTEYLEELNIYRHREKHLKKIFDKDYSNAHEIIQSEIGG